MDIKKLRPDPKGRYSQGYINPASLRKLFPQLRGKPVIYRSSYEKRFMQWLESSDKVVGWGSECMRIPYVGSDGKEHSYFPDYLVQLRNGKMMVVEIKPLSQSRRPVNESSWAYKEWSKNMHKWVRAREWCQARGMEFVVLTENTLDRLS